MGRDITEKHVEELIKKLMKTYHAQHSSSGDTPVSDKICVTFDPPTPSSVKNFWDVSVGTLSNVSNYSTMPNGLNMVFDSENDIPCEISHTKTIINNPVIYTENQTNSKYCFYYFSGKYGIDTVVDELYELDVVKRISMTNDYYFITDIILTNKSYSGIIRPDNDIIILRNVNTSAFMSEQIDVDGIECYKLTNQPITGTLGVHIKSKLNNFKTDFPDIHYNDRWWTMYLTNVRFDIEELKKATGRNNIYEVIL